MATTRISTLPGYPSLRSVINALSTDTVIDLEGGTFQDSDFSMGGNVYTYFGGKLIGLVNGSTAQKPNSSTHAAAVNAQVAANSGTVQETFLRLGRGIVQTTQAYVADLTLIATAQGHIYNGINIYWCTDALIERLTVKGYPGSASYPPGETFQFNNFHSIRTVVKDSLFDGIGVTASNTGNNSSVTMTYIRCQFLNTGSGHGVAHYLSSDPTYIDCLFSGNAKSGANFEKVTGTITMVNPTFHANQVNMIVDTDGPSAVVNIYDPVWDGMDTGTKFKILRHNTYNYPPPAVDANKQLVSGFHIFRGGTWSGGEHGAGTYVGGTETTSTDLQVVTN
ncbi:hypothetical protein [Leifsonia sp. 71-9]|uniref:hypothetical protein n=1 Tax=Leifsonia sp. 71-9 TaxID=1895934 RepID=UPI00092853A4|nr:hypothetical protein [Leifsonia sp. 71-9]OJX72843.1 MAG: hypothetical protein BGO91_13825 [Leifsonia sp. 71-9]